MRCSRNSGLTSAIARRASEAYKFNFGHRPANVGIPESSIRGFNLFGARVCTSCGVSRSLHCSSLPECPLWGTNCKFVSHCMRQIRRDLRRFCDSKSVL